jgi:hypothetical protein
VGSACLTIAVDRFINIYIHYSGIPLLSHSRPTFPPSAQHVFAVRFSVSSSI